MKMKVYRARFSGDYDGIIFRNYTFSTDDPNLQKRIERSAFFKNGEIQLVSDVAVKEPVETVIKAKDSESGAKKIPSKSEVSKITYNENYLRTKMPWKNLQKLAKDQGMVISRDNTKEDVIKFLMSL